AKTKPIHKANRIKILNTFGAAAESIVKSSHQEEGCLQYELHQLHDNSNTFVFFEVWQSQKAVDKHNNTPHFNEFISQVKDRVELLDVKLMSKIA
ncbi:antibiotic biosynthesis monooxygenase, partial [Providencia vermicola]